MNRLLHLPALIPPVPLWAGGFGADRYGVFAELTLGEAVQRFRWIEPGPFMMGSPEGELGRGSAEGPVHEVKLARGFWLGDTPVTQEFYGAVSGANPSSLKGDSGSARTRPVEGVSWNDARSFCARLSGLLPEGAAAVVRLPTEAEWEYACRAGSQAALYAVPFSGEAGRELSTEDGACPNLDPLAWYYENAKGGAQPVKGKTPNSWGLYDMLGNVWEWCEDHWHGNYDGAPVDGRAWLDKDAATGADRVFRGGSWSFRARRCRCAYRRGIEPEARWGNLGCRLVLARSSMVESGRSLEQQQAGGAGR